MCARTCVARGSARHWWRDLIEDATERGMRQMIAVIGDSENAGSIGVHASLGFQMVGTLRSVGVKFGQLGGRRVHAARAGPR